MMLPCKEQEIKTSKFSKITNYNYCHENGKLLLETKFILMIKVYNRFLSTKSVNSFLIRTSVFSISMDLETKIKGICGISFSLIF